MYRGPTRRFDVSPRLLLLGGGLAVAAILAILPQPLAQSVRSAAEIALGPGRRAADAAREGGSRIATWALVQVSSSTDRARAREKLEELTKENRLLRAELASARLQVAALATERSPDAPLLAAEAIGVRTLGTAARSCLAENLLVDSGSSSGTRAGALVVQGGGELVDHGRASGAEKGQLIVAGSRVWGKVISAAAHTSFVCPVTEPGFRDLVRLGVPSADGSAIRFGAKGILEGTGESLARLRMIATTEPVAEGDLVFSLAGEGFVEEPLLCGRVVRVDRPAGSAHWQIWVEPAADRSPARLAILRPVLAAERIVSRPGNAPHQE